MTKEYYVTVEVEHKVVGKYQKTIPDPFARTEIDIDWKTLFWALVRSRKLRVSVIIFGNREAIDYVMAGLDS